MDQIYCDGSLDTTTGQSGAAVTVVRGGRFLHECDAIIRFHDWASPTQAGLAALEAGVRQVTEKEWRSDLL